MQYFCIEFSNIFCIGGSAPSSDPIAYPFTPLFPIFRSATGPFPSFGLGLLSGLRGKVENKK